MLKTQIFLLIALIIFGFFVWGEAKAGLADNVSGWAWSENVGWISFNCNNPELPTPRCTNDYGVNIDPLGGSFSGYAWSENIGWIDFAPPGPYPELPNYSACLDLPGSGQTCDGTGDYKASGWAKAVVDGGGWSGWIKLKDTDYEVTWDFSSGEMEGWAWSDMVIGWISFNCNNPESGDVCLVSDYKVIVALGDIPDTIIDSGPSSPTKETSATFTFDGTESPTSFQCQLDGGGWIGCTSPQNYIVSQGSHTFEVKAINVVGEDPTPASWSWLVDTTDPQVTLFNVSPSSPDWVNKVNPDVTISWTVIDSGGSHLSHVEVWRKPDGGAWVKIGDDYPAPVDSDSWLSSTTDSPSNGTWWYGLHVLDKAGNMGTEPAPIEVLVDKTDPSTAVTAPAAGSWHNDDFTATIDDSDIGDSGLVTDCEYLIVGLNPDPLGDDCSSGVLLRSCDPVDVNVPVGSGACTASNICIFESTSTNRCRVNTRSFDNAGNSSGWKSRSFSIDFTAPTVGQISPLSAQQGIAETFTASLKDEFGKISGCWLYVDGNPKDKDPCTGNDLSIVVNPIPCENGAECTVSVDYCFNTFDSYQMQFSCRDFAGNYGWGEAVTVTVGINNFPVITTGPIYTTSPCAQPTTQSDCNVNFAATIKDDDGDDLTYIWDFGDGVSTDLAVATLPYPVDINTSHHYDTASTYTVILTLSDGRGGEASSSVEVTVTDPTLLVGLVANPNSGVNFLNDVDLTATVSGTTHGTISYYFDCNYNDGVKCEDDTTCPGYVEKGDCCDEKALDQESETHVAVDLCDYASPGDYITRVFVERGAGTAEDTVTITIGENQPPVAAISCCPESCDNPAGECIGYTQSNFCLRNDSTDPDGINDIENSIWTIKEGEEIKEISDCSLSGNPLCDWTLLFTFSRGTYTAELYVEDFQGVSDTATQNFIIKQDAIADFKCSLADLPPESPDWQSCEVIRPTVDEVVYFLDQSSPSEGASITNRSWVFQDGNPPSNTDNEINPSTQFQLVGSKQVSLTITDSAGRTASQDHFISVALPLPEWREIPPF